MKLYPMPGACLLDDLIVLEWIGASHEMIKMSALNGCFLPVATKMAGRKQS